MSSSRLSSPLSSPPSSPLSALSKSPSPPMSYPSPVSTDMAGSRSPSKARDVASTQPGEEGKRRSDRDGPPPAKRRRILEPKERTTEYLTLDNSEDGDEDENDEIQLQRLIKALRTKRKIVVIAGAGISVSAGIPDFRSSTGLFKTLRGQHKLKASGAHLFDASVYKTDSSTTSFHDMVRELSHLTSSAKPTKFHHLIASLAQEGRLLRLYSQNVDGIDTSIEPLATEVPLPAKGPWPKTIQLHGGLEKMICTKCNTLYPFDKDLFEGPEPPSCKACEDLDKVRTTYGGKRSHGIGRLRPRMVLYNEFNPDDEAIGAVSAADLRSRPDAVFVVGTSLKVPGVRRIAREMCAVARGRRGGFTAWINNGPEPTGNEFKESWDLVVRGDCEKVAEEVNLPQWDDQDIGEYQKRSDEAHGEFIKKNKVEIAALENEAVAKTKGILTPTASPRHPSPAVYANGPKTKQPVFEKTNAKAVKPRKPTTSKKPAKKATAQTNKISNTFGISKSTAATVAKYEKHELPSRAQKAAANPAFPNLGKPMHPISPSAIQNNMESQSPEQKCKEEMGKIVSPKNVPKDMGHLLS